MGQQRLVSARHYLCGPPLVGAAVAAALSGCPHALPDQICTRLPTAGLGALSEAFGALGLLAVVGAPVTAAVAAAIATLWAVALLDAARYCCARWRTGADDGCADDLDPEVQLTVAMLSAIESDEAAAVLAAVERGAPIHGPLRGACGITAPQLAALLGKAAALRQLQRLGADLVECHPTRMLGGNCIHGAALGSHTSTTEYLIQESGLFSSSDRALVDLDVPLRNGMTALFLACQAGNLGVVERLAAANADPTITRRDGSTCLFVSAKNGHHRVVQYLLERTKAAETLEARVTKGMQYSGATALWVCCEKGRGESLRLLLCAGAAASVANVAGATALMVAADCGQIDAVQQLLSGGRLSLADVCAKDCNGCDALSFAKDQGHSAIAEMIQSHIVSAEASGDPEEDTSAALAAVMAISQRVGAMFQGDEPTGLLRGSWRCGVSTDLPTGQLAAEPDDAALFELKMSDYPELFEVLDGSEADSSADSASERAAVVRAVEDSCSQMHGTFLQVLQVYRVRCPQAVSDMYSHTVSQLREPSKLHLNNLFHGTNEAAMLSICQHGFDPNHASFRGVGSVGMAGGGAPKMFGNGLYLATNAVRSSAND